ncbi:MAG TPA: hypothetical protein VIF62_12175 [Labilithrix sp.]
MRAMHAIVLASALAAACGELVGAQSDTPLTPPGDEAGTPPAGSDGDADADVADAAPFLCSSITPPPYFCDDFEDASATNAAWTPVTTGSMFAFAPGVSGQAVRFVSSGDRTGVYLKLALKLAMLRDMLRLDFDFSMPAAKINYASVGYLHVLGSSIGTGFGAGLFNGNGAGTRFATAFEAGASSIPYDAAWHHVTSIVHRMSGSTTVTIDHVDLENGAFGGLSTADTFTIFVGLSDLAQDGTLGSLELLVDNVILVTE